MPEITFPRSVPTYCAASLTLSCPATTVSPSASAVASPRSVQWNVRDGIAPRFRIQNRYVAGAVVPGDSGVVSRPTASGRPAARSAPAPYP